MNATTKTKAEKFIAPIQHELKCNSEMFLCLQKRTKQFEIRKEDDKKFKVGDHLFFREWFPEEKKYSGDSLKLVITFILRGAQWGIMDGFAILSTKPY